MKNAERRQTPFIPVDFVKIETQLGAICSQAEDRLQNLLSDERLQAYAKLEEITQTSHANCIDPASSLVSFELRLGSTRLSLDERLSKRIDDIIPLVESEKGLVQIWSRGKMCGKGVLLIVDGKLAVKIEEISR